MTAAISFQRSERCRHDQLDADVDGLTPEPAAKVASDTGGEPVGEPKLRFIKPGEPNGDELAKAHDAETARLLSPKRESELRKRPSRAPRDLAALQQHRAELKRRKDLDRRIGEVIPGYNRPVGIERLDSMLHDRQRLVRSLIRERHPVRGHGRAARVSRCGSRRRERRPRATRRRSSARDGPSDQGEAGGDEPSAVLTNRPLVVVAQLRVARWSRR